LLALLSQLILNGIPAAPYFKLGMARPGSHLTPVLIALRPALVNSNAKHIIAGMAAIAAGLSCKYCRITTSSLPDGRVGVSYTAIVTASEKCDNCGGYSWSFLSWSRCHIPPGLTINSSTGVISGTPTEAGSYHVCVVIIFPNNYRVSRGFNVIIDSCETQDPRTCVNQYCKGCNSRLTQVENSAGRSNHKSWKGGEASGTVCCDKEWWIDVRGSAWGSSCNNKGGDLVEGGWYRCP